MKLPTITAETIDTAKKSLGSLLLLAAVVLELAWPEQGRAITVCTGVGTLLLGLGLQSARGKALEALASQSIGTHKPSDVHQGAINVAARAASLAPPPPTPGSKP